MQGKYFIIPLKNISLYIWCILYDTLVQTLMGQGLEGCKKLKKNRKVRKNEKSNYLECFLMLSCLKHQKTLKYF
jgi:hypothetical protein